MTIEQGRLMPLARLVALKLNHKGTLGQFAAFSEQRVSQDSSHQT